MTSVTVVVPMTIRRRGGRKQIIGPDGAPVRAGDSAAGVAETRGDPALVKALARAFRWRRMLEEGRYASIRELAAAEGVDRAYVGRLLNLTLLAPDVVETNRDDAGLAKRIPFGGTTRGRISSQCLKRHWRLAEDAWALGKVGVPMGVRSKEIVERRILKGADLADPKVKAVAEALLTGLYGDKGTDPKKRQALFFGEPEIAFLAERAAAALAEPDTKKAAAAIETFFKKQRANLRALKDGAGLESALFGRMVTSDPAANRDAAIHVAHALTVHAIERELDYMAAVDDLTSREKGDDAGAAGLFDMELTSGLYYGYVVVDVPLLVANLSGQRNVAARVVQHLLHLIATVSPGAKRGSTAPYAHAELMLVEAGDRQPRTLANAFRDAVPLRTNHLLDTTVERLATHLGKLDAAYGAAEVRRVLNLSETPVPGAVPLGVATLAEWAAAAVRDGQAPGA